LIQPVGTANLADKDLKQTIDGLMEQLRRFEENQEQKLVSIMSMVSNSDANIKALQEKAQFFEIYRHHIGHWTEHMKSMDQKIELLRRGQDQLLTQEAKLSHLDFKVQHIFDKVDVLNEKLHDITKKLYAQSHRQRPVTAGLVEMDSSPEILSRLATLQRHVQNSCRPITVEAINPSTTTVQKMMDTDDLFEVKEYLIRISSQLEKIPVKDLKQVIGVNRKVNRHLESLTEMVRSVDERTIRIFDADAFQSRKMYSSCKNTEHEIRTFTNSADLLLKRIERLVLGLETKTGSAEQSCGNSTTVDKVEIQPRKPEPDEFVPTNEASGDREEKIDDKSENVTPITDSDESGSGDSADNGSGDSADNGNGALDNDSESKEMAEEALDEEQNEFVQPQKSGCHQVKTSGVYKFGLDRDRNQGLRDFNERVCDFNIDDGIGWTVIQNRQPGDAQENFNRSWNEYKNGFGDLHKEFWYGNDFIHK
jgi:angiopoietin 2